MSRLTEKMDNEKLLEAGIRYLTRNQDGIYAVLNKLGEIEDLEEQLEEIFGGKLTLSTVVDNLNRIVQNGEEKLDFARILTNAEAEKWDKWKDLEEQGRLIEQKHGEWIYGLDEYDIEFLQCPLCDGVFYDGDNDTFDTPYNYCPNCGAKMDEVEK